MRIITVILVCQFILGLVVAVFAYGHIHSAAMGMEYSDRMRRDLEQMRQSPEFREPPEVRGYSMARLIEYRYTVARERGHAALLAFGTGLGASFLAGISLWLLGRVRRKDQK